MTIALTDLRKSVQQRGVMETAVRCLAEPFYKFQDWRFDGRFNVQTSGNVAIDNLDVAETDRRHAEKYEPVRLHAFAELMRILAIRHEEFMFVDFGSGKGRAVLLASEFPFRQIVGIELSPDLCRIAAENVRNYKSATQRCQHLEITCQNAAAYAILPEPTVFYFYNPFGEAVMRTVLANLRESLLSHPREVFLVLYNPVLDDLVGQVDFLRLFKTTGRCSIYESAGAFGRGPD